MIRPSLASDGPAILSLAAGTGVFKPHEIKALDEVLTDYHASNRALGHSSITIERDGEILGFAYYAPASMTDRTWYLYWIAVLHSSQARGIGSELLSYAEQEICSRQGRLLLIETSSLPHYAPTRKFYVKHGYHQTAVIRDFYADGDDMVIFAKRLDISASEKT